MSIPDYLRHSAHKKVVDALISDPKNQTLTSGEIYKAKANKLEAERYDSFLNEVNELNEKLLEQLKGELNDKSSKLHLELVFSTGWQFIFFLKAKVAGENKKKTLGMVSLGPG